jgi:hypothetical protein
MSQNERLLTRLRIGPMCAMEPLDWTPRIYRTAARIKDLRDAGQPISTDVCGEHRNNHAVYKLETQDQGELF